VQGGSPECGYRYDWPAVATRVVSYDGSTNALEQDFSYTTTWGVGANWTSKTTTVTTKDLKRGTSFSTIYTYFPMPQPVPPGGVVSTISPVPVESTIQYNDINGKSLQTVTEIWGSPNGLLAKCTTLPNGQTSGIFYQHPFGNGVYLDLVTDKAEYDYGLVSSTSCVQPSSAPTRETLTTYQSFAITPINTYIQDRPASVTIKDHGTVISQTNYYYTNATTSVSSAIAHDESHYGPSSTAPRENLASVTQSCLQSCTSPTTSYGYDETGRLISVTDPNKNTPTTYNYTDSYSSGYGTPGGNTNTYVTTVTAPTVFGSSHIDRYQYGFNNGKMTSHTDQNTNATYYYYLTSGYSGGLDPWARLSGVKNPDTGGTTIGYTDVGPQPTTTTSVVMSSSENETTETIFDAYGHALHTKLTTDPDGIDIVDTTYDGMYGAS
jgi:YD repeat-containing protein